MDPIPARWPFAVIVVDTQEFPALVVEWVKVDIGPAGRMWHARCLYVRDGEPRDDLIPAQRVTKVGG